MTDEVAEPGTSWDHGAALGDRDVSNWLAHPPSQLDPDNPPPPRPSFDAAPDPIAAGWLGTVLRFTRPDGSAIFGPRGRAPARLIELERLVRQVGDPSLARIFGWWRPASRVAEQAGWVAPPLPTETWPDRPLAILRPDWTLRGSLLAVDHRAPGTASLVEVAGRGVPWLGPRWTSPPVARRVAAAPRAGRAFAASGPFADAFEWSFAAGPVAVTRTAVLIRGAGLALLLQSEEGVGDGTGEVRWALPEGIAARPDGPTRALILDAGRGRPQGRLVPLGLPEANYPTERGSLVVEGREVVLRERTTGPNRCLALLVAWSSKPPRGWRTLTVAERSAACPPGTAFAARVGWGSGQNGLLVYRSLGPGGLRSVLGYQTKSPLLIAGFSPTGEVHPWIRAPAGPAPPSALAPGEAR